MCRNKSVIAEHIPSPAGVCSNESRRIQSSFRKRPVKMMTYCKQHASSSKLGHSHGALYNSMNTTQPTAASRSQEATVLTCGEPELIDADIVIPVYNESEALAKSIDTLHQYLSENPDNHVPFSWNIVIADNASTDETWDIAQRLCSEYPGEVRAVHIDRKGRGYALKHTWGHSLAKVRAYMDVDLSTDITATPALIGCLLGGDADIAIGSRLMKDSQVTRSAKREFISRTYNLMLRNYLGATFHDAQCGFKAITARTAHVLLDEVQDNEWFFDTELLVLAQEHGMRLAEIPVRWVEDTGSTVNIPDTVAKDLSGMHRMHRAMNRNPDQLTYRLSSRYSTLGWDSTGQRQLRGSLLESTASAAMRQSKAGA